PTTTSRTFSFRYGDSSVFLYGDSAMVLPAYLFNSGFGSNVSIWLAPPTMNSQMTDFALAFGETGATGVSPRATPSLNNIAPNATPVTPRRTPAGTARREQGGLQAAGPIMGGAFGR